MGFLSKKERLFDSTSKPSGLKSYQIQGKTITCPHCGKSQFEERQALLNTAGMTFFKLDWANKSATILICTQCSQIQWFLQPPEPIAE